MAQRGVASAVADIPGGTSPRGTSGIWTIIGASATGTMIEWYDFYIFGSLALVLADQFITPALNRPEFNVQWFFRLLALAIVICIVLVRLFGRRQPEASPSPAD